MMKAIFVTGTDTGVGKTIVCSLLNRYFLEKGYRVITQKWIETGVAKNSGKNNSGPIFPYRFKLAASAHLAAAMENKKIKAARIIKAFKALSAKYDFVIVEGIGGALVPFDKKHLVIDIAKQLKLPVLVVSRNRLGAINHTLLTIEALQKRRMNILGLVFNNLNKDNKAVIKDNPRIIKALTGEKIFGILPKMGKKEELYKKFMPIGKRIYEQLA